MTSQPSVGDLIRLQTTAVDALASVLGIDLFSEAAQDVEFEVVGGNGIRLESLFTLTFDTFVSSLFDGRSNALVMDAAGLRTIGMQAFRTGEAAEFGVVAVATINVSAQTLADVGGDLSRLEVRYLNEATGEAEPVTIAESPAPGVLAFEFTREGTYAVLVNLAEDPGPAQTVPAPADTGMGAADSSTKTTAYLALAGVLAAIVVTGAGARYTLRRTRE